MSENYQVEFHCHTEFSNDSLVSVQELIETARRVGLQRVVVTDHNTIRGALAAQDKDPDLVIVGEEILTTQGELLASFVTREIPKYLEPIEAITRLREQGAFISVSHPFDQRRHGWKLRDLERIAPLVDAVEVFNSRCQMGIINKMAAEFARKHAMPGTVGSDAHTARELGRSRMLLPNFSTGDQLRQVIGEGESITEISSPFIHLTSTYARFIKAARKTYENSSD